MLLITSLCCRSVSQGTRGRACWTYSCVLLIKFLCCQGGPLGTRGRACWTCSCVLLIKFLCCRSVAQGTRGRAFWTYSCVLVFFFYLENHLYLLSKKEKKTKIRKKNKQRRVACL